MGCSSSVQAVYHPSKQWVDSPVGLLSVTIVSFSLTNNHSIFSSKFIPHAKLTVSNQTFITKKDIEAQAQKQTSVDETFQFSINSCYQANGRTLDCEVWSDSFFTGGKIGHGQVQLNDIINQNQQKDVICSLYQGDEVKGTVKLKIGFTNYPYDRLSFKMINALIINKGDEDLSKRKVYVRVEIGEEILETKPCVESEKRLPHWENQVLTVRVPSYCETGKVTVFMMTPDSDLVVGSFDIDMPNLLQTRPQRMFDEIFSVFHEGKQQVKGTLKFYTRKGSQNFVEMVSPRKQFNNPEDLYKISPELEIPDELRQKKSRERSSIKNKLLQPLPALEKKKTSTFENGLTLHKVQVENPEA